MNIIESFNNDATNLLYLESLLIKNMKVREAIQDAMELYKYANSYSATLSNYDDSK